MHFGVPVLQLQARIPDNPSQGSGPSDTDAYPMPSLLNGFASHGIEHFLLYSFMPFATVKPFSRQLLLVLVSCNFGHRI